VAGYLGLPEALGGTDRFARFLEPVFASSAMPGAVEAGHAASGGLEMGLMAASIVAAVCGIGLAVFFFLGDGRAAEALAGRFPGLYRALDRKLYVDEVYDAAVVQPLRIVSEEGLWRGVDVRVIDGAVNGVADVVRGSADMLRRVQTGSLRAYAVSLLLGAVLVVGYYLW
jgi:NADH-quinone oxidoreductase subunit L